MIKVSKVEIVTQGPDATEIRVAGDADGNQFDFITDIREGRSQPDARDAAGNRLDLDDEFVIAVHEALDEQHPELMEREMIRILGE